MGWVVSFRRRLYYSIPYRWRTDPKYHSMAWLPFLWRRFRAWRAGMGPCPKCRYGLCEAWEYQCQECSDKQLDMKDYGS